MTANYCTLGDVMKDYGETTFTWYPWIPNGHVTLIGGDAGMTKTGYALKAILPAMLGYCDFPDGQRIDQSIDKVLYLETESMRGEIAQSLFDMGIDVERVVLPSGDDNNTSFIVDLSRDEDYRMIGELLESVMFGAVFLDSLSGGHNEDENSPRMSKVMKRLTSIAQTYHIPVIVVHHVNKGRPDDSPKVTMHRLRGHSSIYQYPRSIMGIYTIDGTTEGIRKVEHIKSQFSAKVECIGFYVDDDGLHICEAPKEDGDMIMSQPAIDKAVEFLKSYLPAKPNDIFSDSKKQHISRAAIYRAKALLNVVKIDGKWKLI